MKKKNNIELISVEAQNMLFNGYYRKNQIKYCSVIGTNSHWTMYKMLIIMVIIIFLVLILMAFVIGNLIRDCFSFFFTDGASVCDCVDMAHFRYGFFSIKTKFLPSLELVCSENFKYIYTLCVFSLIRTYVNTKWSRLRANKVWILCLGFLYFLLHLVVCLCLFLNGIAIPYVCVFCFFLCVLYQLRFSSAPYYCDYGTCTERER